MRALILIAAIFALAACSNNDQADNTQNIDENLIAENIVSNDVTAIDAVTGDAANMAADAEVNDLGNISNDEGNTAAFPRPKPQTTSSPAPKPSAGADVSNATGNSD
jgi:hypothetical protein